LWLFSQTAQLIRERKKKVNKIVAFRISPDTRRSTRRETPAEETADFARAGRPSQLPNGRHGILALRYDLRLP
jgi:hypothetical protein